MATHDGEAVVQRRTLEVREVEPGHEARGLEREVEGPLDRLQVPPASQVQGEGAEGTPAGGSPMAAPPGEASPGGGRPSWFLPAVIGGSIAAVLVVVVLAVTGSAPGFLTLLLPLLAVLLPWFGAYGVRVRDLSGSPLAGALAQAPPVALLVAITTPLV